MAFTQPNLSIGQEELEQIRDGLENLGLPDAITNACVSRDRQVRDWTARYTVPEDTLKRLWNALVIWELYTNLNGEIPSNRQKAYDEAVLELTAIRDGKFPQYPLAATQPAGFDQSGSDWGSEDRI